MASVTESLGRLRDPETLKLVVVTLVPLALVKKIFVVVIEVKVVLPKLEIPDTYKFVVVTPIPTMDNPPMMVVETLVAPIWIPPAAPLVPIKIVVVPGPVPILIVLEVPIPRDRVCATEEFPTVIRPVPWGAPMVRAPASLAGFNLVTLMLVPVALEKVKVVKFALVEVTLVPVAVVKPNAPDRVPPVRSK